jgi:hypothetical protein
MLLICLAFPLILYLITLKYLKECTDYETPHYAVFSSKFRQCCKIKLNGYVTNPVGVAVTLQVNAGIFY